MKGKFDEEKERKEGKITSRERERKKRLAYPPLLIGCKTGGRKLKTGRGNFDV